MGWEEALRRSLKTLKINPAELGSMRKSGRRKVANAGRMKSTTSVTNGCLSESLYMGKPNAVSDYCGRYVWMLSENCPLAKKLRTEQ